MAAKTNPREVAEHLLKQFPIYDARLLYTAWYQELEEQKSKWPHLFPGESSIPKEQYNGTFNAAVELKDKHETLSIKPPSITGAELRDLKIPKPSWIINKVIPAGGLVAISGKPGSYKSFFALWLATRAAAGLPLFDSLEVPFFCDQDTNLAPTMFIEEENTLVLTQDRYVGLKSAPDDHLHFRVDQSFKMQDEAWRMALLADVEAKGISLIIMDPFSSVMGLEDENDNAEVAKVMDIIRKEFLTKGITIVFIHHPSKGDDGGKNLRGAGDILGKCDVQLHLEKDPEDKQAITVSYEKMRLIRDDEVANFKMRLCGDTLFKDMHFKYIGEAEPKHEKERRILAESIKRVMQPGQIYLKSVIAENVGQNTHNDKFRAAFELLEKNKEISTSIETKNGHPLFRLT